MENTQTETSSFVTFKVDEQTFGVPVAKVQDILVPDAITPVPLAPEEICGVINLRGRIVTVIDVRSRLGRSGGAGRVAKPMGVTVEGGAELYTLLVDSVGEVAAMPASARDATPATLDPLWSDLADGVYRLDGQLLVTLNVDRLMQFRPRS